MSAGTPRTRILVIRPWTVPLAPLRAALQARDLEARIVRVDIEPAVNAALERGGFDVIVHDPETPGVSRRALEALLRTHRRRTPIIEIDDPDDVDAIAERIGRALADLAN